MRCDTTFPMNNVLHFPTKHDPLLEAQLLANHWGVSRKTIKRYVRAGMPAEGGRYRLSAVEAWRRERAA
jgi:hypothetical protein